MSRSAPVVLSCYVRADEDVSLRLDAPKPEQQASRPLSCVSRRVIGVSRSIDANNALNDLLLETHLADAPGLSRLTLRGKGGIRLMLILAIDYKLILLGSCLPLGGTNVSPPTSQVYLVYDAVEQSITMIPSYPWLKTPQQPGVMRKTVAAISVLVARPPGGDGRSYALVNMAETTIYSGRNHSSVQDVLYVWRSWTSGRRWDLITTNFPARFKGENFAHSYRTVLAFSCGGWAFWVNLLRGVMYCSLDALLSDSNGDTSNGDPKLEFRFISLPDDLPEIPDDLMYGMEMASGMFRTMGRVGESSIKFVTIDGFLELWNFRSCRVKVWSLSPAISMTKWTKSFLCLDNLVNQHSFKEAKLPTDMVPMYPRLNPEEEDVIYFMLGKYDPCCRDHYNSKGRCKGYATTAGKPLYQLRVDMRLGVLLSSAPLPDQTSPSVILADTSVVPSPMVPSVVPAPMIQRGSTVGRKGKRSRGALTS